MKWPYNVTAGEREGAIMVFNARKEDISDFAELIEWLPFTAL